MKKLFFVIAIAFLTTGIANAQRRSTVSGVVADAETRQGLIGVVVELTPASDSTRASVIVSGAGGLFSTGLAREPHSVRASMMGYEPLIQNFEVTEAARQSLDTLFITPGILIDAVVKEAVAMRTSMAGDTLIYNADSYKVAADATVSSLLEKMPGIRVSGGTVEAQGETVQKVLIDNREFFGEDVAAAITSLPAEAVKSIEVFDKLSDNAEFTGIDDGQGYKAINISTRESMRQGIMGQVSAMYGAEPPETDDERWHQYGLVGGNVNIFQGDAKVTVGGTLNNLNERSFTSNDILGAGSDDGIAKVGRFQANYIDQLGKRNQWSIDASYSYNITDAEGLSIINREYFLDDNALYRNYDSETRRNTINTGHSLQGRIDFKPNANHELRVRPFLRFQGNDSSRTGSEIFYPVDGSQPITLENWNKRDEKGFMAGINANYRVRLGKPGRTLSLFLNANYDPDERSGESYSERQDGTPRQQYTPSSNYTTDYRVGLTYTEPVSASSLINLDYSVGYNYSDQDMKAYLWVAGLDDYDMTAPDRELSGVYNSGYLTHRVGPGYRMQKGKTTFSAGVFYQYSTLESQRVLPVEFDLKRSFNNITYASMLDTQFPNGASIRLFLNSMTRNPDVNQLQDVVNISNVQNITKGNINLRPQYGNMFYARFIIPNVEKGRTLAINLGGNLMSNSIVPRTIIESPGYQVTDAEGNVVETLDAVGRYTEQINMDGDWSGRFGIDYGFPVRFLRSNLNLEAGVSYRESPSQIGRWTPSLPAPVYLTNYMSVLSSEAGITLGSNISERVDFRLSYEAGYNRVRNTFSASSNSEYLEQEASVDFKFVLPASFTLSGNMEWEGYNSLSGQDFSRDYIIANAAIGKKVFRNRQGEISLFVNDIFNQNISFRRNAQAQYIQNQIDTAIGRYFGVKFTWNIRYFGKNGSTNMDLYDTGGRGGRGGFGPGGPPPGGPPPGGGGPPMGGGRGFGG
jgi:hypothetical protein